jgi:hypothetical protein
VAETQTRRLQIAARTALFGVALACAALLSHPHHAALAASDCTATGSPQGPFSFDTWEAGDYKTRYGAAMELAANNQLFPNDPDFALPPLGTGDRAAGSGTTTAPYIPPVILKAIAYIESGWAQASYDPLVKYGETGLALVSADCGYGLMQVTSGMQNVSGIPSLAQTMIGSNYAFNVAGGAQILAQKWNEAPELHPIVGNRDPHVIENWYFVLWAYNGFAYRNHPLNPGYDPQRPPYDCQPNTPRDYPYQELIFGCIANPPLRDGVPLWPAQPVTLPDLSDPAFSGPLDPSNWNACSYQAQCAPMDIPTPGGAGHIDPTVPSIDPATLLGQPAIASASSVNVTPAGTAAQEALTVANPGSGLASWLALGSTPWISTSPLTGISLGAEHGGYSTPLTVNVDPSGMPPGDYIGNVTVESTAAAGAPLSIPVTLHVGAPSNCDGHLDAADALAVLQEVGGVGGVGGCVADVPDMNCDGAINSADALLVLQYLAGLSSGPAPCG